MFDYKQKPSTPEYEVNYAQIFNTCKCEERELIGLLDKNGKIVCPKCYKEMNYE